MFITADSVLFIIDSLTVPTKSISSITCDSASISLSFSSGGKSSAPFRIVYSSIIFYNGSINIPSLAALVVEFQGFLRTALTLQVSFTGISLIKGDKGDPGDTTDATGLITGIATDYYNTTFFKADRSYMYITVKNTTANVCQLSGGTTPGGFELFTNFPIAANAYTQIPINQGFVSDTPIYIHHGGSGDDWNGASLNIKSASNEI